MSIDIIAPHGIMFHQFRDKTHPAGQGAISADQFRTLLLRLDRATILSAEEWLEKFLSNTLEKGARCLTFDDGLLCQYDVALQVLDDLNIKAFFFPYTAHLEGMAPRLDVYRYFRSVHFETPQKFYHEFFEDLTQFIPERDLRRRLAEVPRMRFESFPDFYSEDDRYFQVIRDFVLTEEEYQSCMDTMIEERGLKPAMVVPNVLMSESHLKNLAREGHFLGLHSHNHPLRLEDISEEEQRLEYVQCEKWLRRLGGQSIKSMSHPSNSYGPETLYLLREMGIKLGFRADTKGSGGSKLEVPRLDHMECCIALSVIQP